MVRSGLLLPTMVEGSFPTVGHYQSEDDPHLSMCGIKGYLLPYYNKASELTPCEECVEAMEALLLLRKLE